MKIKDILNVKGSKVWTIQGTQTLREASKILVSQGIGALPVLDPKSGHVTGIVSERDIVRAGIDERGRTPDQILVKEIMTAQVIFGTPGDEMGQVMEVMTRRRIRHIPILDSGRLAGIISIGDVVKAILEDSKHEIESLKEYLYGPGAILA